MSTQSSVNTTSGKVVLISGASRGIGLATAQLLAERGCTVFGGSRYPDQVSVSGFTLLQLDVRHQESVNHFVEAVLHRAGRIDVLINNAGISLAGAVEEATPDDARRLFETNFFSVIRLTNAVLPYMRAQRSGKIINISSIAGIIGVPYLGIYAASKYALEGYSESLRHELRDLGITVSLIEPGDIHTSIVNEPPSNRFKDYDGVRERTEAVHQSNVRNGPPPERVAQVILRVVQSRSPRLRYRITQKQEFWVPWMKRLLPDFLTERLVRDNYHLDERNSS